MCRLQKTEILTSSDDVRVFSLQHRLSNSVTGLEMDVMFIHQVCQILWGNVCAGVNTGFHTTQLISKKLMEMMHLSAALCLHQ